MSLEELQVLLLSEEMNIEATLKPVSDFFIHRSSQF